MIRRIQTIPIKSIRFVEKIYPRNTFNWILKAKYYQHLIGGFELPPITVNKVKSKYILIDGYHRLQALKDLKRKVVKAEIYNDLPEKEAFILAVRLNAQHGQPLSSYDIARVIDRLKKYKISKQKIAQIVHIPIGKLDKFVSSRIVKSSDKAKTYLRKSIKHLSNLGKVNLTSEQLDKVDTGETQIQIIDNLISIVKYKLFDVDNPIILKKLDKLYKELKKVLIVE